MCRTALRVRMALRNRRWTEWLSPIDGPRTLRFLETSGICRSTSATCNWPHSSATITESLSSLAAADYFFLRGTMTEWVGGCTSVWAPPGSFFSRFYCILIH